MTLYLQIGGKSRRVDLPAELGAQLASGPTAPSAGELACTVDGESVSLDVQQLQPGVISLLIAGRAYRCILDEGPTGRSIFMDGRRYPYVLDDPRSLRQRRGGVAGDDGPRSIKSPMPGRVARLLVAVGAAVKAQEGILVIEAMKMQNEMKSPKDGVVTAIHVAAGDTVHAGQVLAVVE